jgi:hypothetical protein
MTGDGPSKKKKPPRAVTAAQIAIAQNAGAAAFQEEIKKAIVGPEDATRRPNAPPRKRAKTIKDKISEDTFVGVDGEGKGRNPHLYVMLCAADEYGKNRWSVENQKGLSTSQCLDFLLELPASVKCFAFSFNYDLTKILSDVPNDALYRLVRPELRQRPPGSKVTSPFPVRWTDPQTEKLYYLNLQGSKFTVSVDYVNKKGKRARRNRVVWDTFKFYQSKFTAALRDWRVATASGCDNNKACGAKDCPVCEIEIMKDKRSEFDKLEGDAIRDYCFSECMYLGQLARKLVDAHADAGLELRNFYGAGSSASAMLEIMGIKEKRREPPDAMKEAVCAAFFGGRFEHSVIGPIEGPVYSFDISSAYPYQCCFLPCLEHGTWTKTKSRGEMLKARAALVQYKLAPTGEKLPWAPFPYRDGDGSITFPDKSGGGWVWRDEYLSGEKLFPYVGFRQAWVLESNCKCEPFKQISRWYMNRLRLGKEGAGIALKLGCNSCYGKLAQSVGGTPPFQSWIWAGMITSGCRAQILDLMALHDDLSNLLSIATDGIYTREDIKTPVPKDTGTMNARRSIPETEAAQKKGEACKSCGAIGCDLAHKPLGGWERKVVKKGVFFARPGIYFPLNPTQEELKTVRARGIGRAAMFEAWRAMVDAFAEGKEQIHIENDKLERFCGMKSQISVSGVNTPNPVYKRSVSYGRWVPRPTDLSLNPLPKRDGTVIRPPGTAYGILTVRAMDARIPSTPYNRAVGEKALDAQLLKLAELEAMEQPDGGDLEENDLLIDGTDDYFDDVV